MNSPSRGGRPYGICTPRRFSAALSGLRKAKPFSARLASLATLAALIALTVVGASSAQAALTHPYTGTSFGPGGVGSGAFGRAVAVTVAQSSGDVFVLDASEGGRLYKFDAAGEPVDFSESGTNVIAGVGSAGGSEEELAVDDSGGPANGDIYVANNSAVRIYAASGAFLGELSGGEMCGVAVDPSGSVYVGVYGQTVRRYMPVSNPVTNEDEDGSIGGLSGVCNVAVDAAGDVYAARYSGEVTKYDALQFGSLSASGELVEPLGRTLAVDPSSGEVFIDEENQISQYEGSAEPPRRLGTSASAGPGALSGSFGVGVDHASGELYAANGEAVEIFGPGVVVAGVSTEAASGVSNSTATLHGTVEPAGTEVTGCVFEYGSEAGALSQSAPCEPAPPYTGTALVAVTAQLSGLNPGAAYSYRIAASNASGTVYGAEEILHTAGPPTIGSVEARNARQHSVKIYVSIDPHALDTHYHVEYGTGSEYGSSTPSADVGTESATEEVELSGLALGTTYHFRVIAANAEGTAESVDMTFTTEPVASITEESALEVGSSSATLSARALDFEMAATAHFEYGTTNSYGAATPSTTLAPGEYSIIVTAALNALQPATTYHFRLVVESEAGTERGSDVTFTTHPVTAPPLELSDGRGYEKVSPNANADGNVYQDMPLDFATEGGGSFTELPFAIATDGSSIAYPADPSETGGVGHESGNAGNEYIAKRAPTGGWSAVNEDPPSATFEDFPVYQGFSPDLSVGFLTSSGKTPLAPGAPGKEYASLYARTFASGAYQALLTTNPPHRGPEEFRAFGAPGISPVSKPEPQYAGSSADSAHALFIANDALTSNAVDGGAEANNLYDSHDGTLTLVNVLPDGSSDANATFGGPVPPPSPPTEDIPALNHDLSADGSRIFWTDLNTHDLYVRENDTEPQSPISEGRCTVTSDACTVLIAEGAQFWNATPDGSKVLYTKGGDLYEYELASAHSTDLAPGGEIQGIVGTSEDLSYVYFVADAALAPGAKAQHCAQESAAEESGEAQQTNGCNLYAIHLGEPPRFVGALSLGDIQNALQSFYRPTGDWVAGLGNKEAEATPDGGHLLFTSKRPLTGYDNRKGSAETEQAFVYDFASTQLSCVSCNATGEAPTGEFGAYLPTSRMYTYLPHWMSDDGDKVFFDTLQSLVRQDTNNVTDVYEWERDGSGSCVQSPGCISLISDGTAYEGSYLIGTTATGDDAFFTTRSNLVDEDENDNIDVYDARVGAASAPVAPRCSGSGCQGVPSAPPVFSTPSSTTYNGVGNFASVTRAAPGAKPKPLTRAQKLATALKACHKQARRKRAACEAQARKKYGAKRKKAKSATRRSVKTSSKGGKR